MVENGLIDLAGIFVHVWKITRAADVFDAKIGSRAWRTENVFYFKIVQSK